MSSKTYRFSAVIASLLLTAVLAGCGSSNREGSGSTNLSNVARVASEGTCRVCHADTIDPVSQRPLLADFLTATNSHNQPGRVDGVNADLGCQGCHGGGAEHNGIGPIPFPDPLASNRCIVCHTSGGLADTSHDLTQLFELAKTVPNGFVNNCAHCHTDSGVGGIHGAKVPETANCLACHDIAAPQHGTNRVGDNNNGVRAITTEFNKWSHHVTGVTLNSAHCAACHLAGTVAGGSIAIDETKHMADAQVHLRNADDDTDFVWDPAAPNHTNMDNFCMSCHDANGATSPVSIQIQALINGTPGLPAAGKTASARNPFGDTISNRYDKMQRPGVVDASSQFNVGNNSHHAVKGPRYAKRTRIANAADPRAMTAAQSTAFAANSTALLKGARSTMYDAKIGANSVLNQLYVPLENAAGEVAPRTGSETLGDDSTLHCGDCHTVGQWKVGSSVDSLGRATSAAIGAHGSNNEYLLRNSIGTDQRHTQNAYVLTGGVVTFTNPGGAFLVCYNCHAYAQYGSVYNATGVGQTGGLSGPHAGEYDQAGRCDGVGNTLPFNGYTTGTATDGTQFRPRLGASVIPGTTTGNSLAVFAQTPAFAPGFPLIGTPPTGEQNADFGDIFGIQCLNCHNSGLGNAYGGIHGSFNNTNTLTQTTATSVLGGAYIDGMGNTTKVERFLPGLGNAMHVPGTLGGITGGVTATSTTTVPYTYTTGGISNDSNWEQKHWQQTAATSFGPTGAGPVSGTLTSAGAGCYTLGANTDAATSALRGPSVTGIGGPATVVFDTWGGCDDHNAAQGNGDHGFVKRIVRPITY